MKKAFLSILLIVSMLSFFSCDDNSLPKVSAEKASEALGLSLAAQTTALFSIGFGVPVDGFSYDVDATTGVITYTFTSFDLADFEVGTYTSMSGTIVQTSTTSTYNLTFSGGDVVTFYMVLDATGATAFEVNGHDMLSEVTITATHN